MSNYNISVVSLYVYYYQLGLVKYVFSMSASSLVEQLSLSTLGAGADTRLFPLGVHSRGGRQLVRMSSYGQKCSRVELPQQLCGEMLMLLWLFALQDEGQHAVE